jgi:hypothetical protein
MDDDDDDDDILLALTHARSIATPTAANTTVDAGTEIT